ncbi:hypothetical protein MUG91_G70n16 [Manis pentadactyla]|nr:hypothetical protein MUG91_G70n16 [Manis pentadactyla]
MQQIKTGLVYMEWVSQLETTYNEHALRKLGSGKEAHLGTKKPSTNLEQSTINTEQLTNSPKNKKEEGKEDALSTQHQKQWQGAKKNHEGKKIPSEAF